MNIIETVDKFKDALPGYKLVGYTDLGIPYFQSTLQCLVLDENRIPVVEEFVLNLYNQGLTKEEIALVLGIDIDLVDKAWVELLRRDYINCTNETITVFGKNYIEVNYVSELDKIFLNVSINGLTGEITRYNDKMMSSKESKLNGIPTIRAILDKPNIDNIPYDSLKRVFNQYKKFDRENYSGNLLDLIEVKNKLSKFKRVNILVFENNEKKIRFLVYEGLDLQEGYENALFECENKGYNVLNNNYTNYFEAKEVDNIDKYLFDNKSDDSAIGISDVTNKWSSLLDANNSNIFISIPLIEVCTPSSLWIEEVEKSLKANNNITILITGRDFTSEYQKNSYIY